MKLTTITNKLIAYSLFTLTALLPIHNLIVQVATKRLGLPSAIAGWKDVFVGLLILLFFGQIIAYTTKIIKQSGFKTIRLELAFLAGLVSINIWAFVTTFLFNKLSLQGFVFGYYFEIWWLNLSVLLPVWYWLRLKINSTQTKQENQFLLKGLIISLTTGFALTSLVTIPSLIFGQEQVLSIFGYGDKVEGSLIGSSNICHTIDYGIATCRSSGTFAHPVHFTAYLLFVLPLFSSLTLYFWDKIKLRYGFLTLAILSLVFNLFTFSRYAWLGLFCFFAFLALIFITKKLPKTLKLAQKTLAFLMLAVLIGGIGSLSVDPEWLATKLPRGIVKPSSTAWHYRHIMVGLDILKESGAKSLTGFGIGASGSAAREKYQDLDENALAVDYEHVAYRWLFVKETYLLMDNWFLQVAVNGGLIYALIYAILSLIPLVFLKYIFKSWDNKKTVIGIMAGLAFFSVLIGNLLQQIWENQTVAHYWVLAFLIFSLLIHTFDQNKTLEKSENND